MLSGRSAPASLLEGLRGESRRREQQIAAKCWEKVLQHQVEQRRHDTSLHAVCAVRAALRRAAQAVESKRREVLEGPPCKSFFVTFK